MPHLTSPHPNPQTPSPTPPNRNPPQAAGTLAARDVIRALLSALSSGVPPLQHQLYLLAVGHCSREHYGALAQELAPLMDEYQRPSSSRQRAKSAARPEEVGVAILRGFD